MDNIVTKPRLGYIDALRGFSMFLVVLGHVSIHSFKLNTVLASFFITFRMPLFFFISGFIGYKALAFWTKENYFERLRKKLFVQLVPMLIFSSLFAFVNNVDYTLFLTQGFRGYWFTFVLLQMFFVYYTLSLLSKYLGKKIFIFSIVFINFIMLAFLFMGNRRAPFWSYLCLENGLKYFQFFSLGIICRMFQTQFLNIVSNNTFRTVTITSFFLLFCSLYSSHVNPIIYQVVKHIVVRYLGVMMVFSIFYSCKESFDTDSRWSNCIKFIGKRTLDIYLLHYFFLPQLTQFSSFFSDSNQILFELLAYTVISFAVITLCLSCSWIIRRSSTLAYWCFGSRI